MISSPILLAILHAAIIPTIGIWALLATKLMVGNRLRWAERCFMGILLTVSFAALHSVMTDAHVWFVHMLTLAFRLHDMCFRLQRYCYIQLYDSAYEQYFTYANRDRWTWQGSRKELKPYGSQKRITLNCTLEQRWEPYVERVLFPALAAHADESLLHARVRGWIPFETSADTFVQAPLQLQGAISAALADLDASAHKLPGLSPCMCRYVTQPPPTVNLLAHARPAAFHLRTGFADVEDAVLGAVRPSPRASAAWLQAACGAETPFDLAQHFVMSDSPGLVRQIGRVPTRKIAPNDAARSWMVSNEVKFSTLDDVVIAGASRRLHVATQHANIIDFACWSINPCVCSLVGKNGIGKDPGLRRRPAMQWSSFYRPLLTRSMCIERVGMGIPQCPNYAAVFIRDFATRFAPNALAVRELRKAQAAAGRGGGERVLVNTSNANEVLKVAGAKQCLWEMMQPLLAAANPCKTLTPQQCHHFFLAALQ